MTNNRKFYDLVKKGVKKEEFDDPVTKHKEILWFACKNNRSHHLVTKTNFNLITKTKKAKTPAFYDLLTMVTNKGSFMILWKNTQFQRATGGDPTNGHHLSHFWLGLGQSDLGFGFPL